MSLSTITHKIAFPLLLGNPVMKFMTISSHTVKGIGSGYSKLASLWLSIFACWQIGKVLTKVSYIIFHIGPKELSCYSCMSSMNASMATY